MDRLGRIRVGILIAAGLVIVGLVLVATSFNTERGSFCPPNECAELMQIAEERRIDETWLWTGVAIIAISMGTMSL